MNNFIFLFLFDADGRQHIFAGESIGRLDTGIFMHVMYEINGIIMKTDKQIFIPWHRVYFSLFGGAEYDALIKRLEDAGYKGDRETA